VEGFPLAPLEAMAAERPVLLSDIPPHRELLLAAPQAGWLVFDGGWPQALRGVAAESDDALTRAGQAGAAHVRAHHGWDRVATETLAVYREITG